MAPFFIFLLSTLPLSLPYPTEAGVYELTTSTIDQWHSEFIDHLRFVQFYAPFDQKSKVFSPEYIALSREAAALSPAIIFGKVDISKYENKQLIGKYMVGDFPFLVFFRAGGTNFQAYDGEKDVKSMLYCLKRHQFNVTKVTEIEQFDRIYTAEYPIHGMLLAVVHSAEAQLATVFREYAKVNAGKFAFGMVEDNGEFAARFDLEGDAVVVARPNALLGKDDLAYKTITKASNLTDFHASLSKAYLTSISLWSHYTEDIVKSHNRPIVTLYFHIDWQRNLPHVRYMANRLRRIAENYFMYDESQNKFTFTVADRNEYRKELERKQLFTSNVLLTIQKGESHFYALQENRFMMDERRMRTEAVSSFLDDYLSGKLDTYVRSQEVPDEDFDRNVRVVVGQTFKKVILHSLKHVILLVYRTPHSESHSDNPQVQEVFSQLGALLKTSDTILAAKVEVTLNEIPGDYTALEYPKIFFIPENEKYRPVSFDSSPVTLESLVSFVNHHIDSRKSHGKSPEL